MFSQEQILLMLIPAAPLAACLITALFGWLLRGRSHWPVILALGLSFACSLMLLRDMQIRCKQASNHAGQGRLRVDGSALDLGRRAGGVGSRSRWANRRARCRHAAREGHLRAFASTLPCGPIR